MITEIIVINARPIKLTLLVANLGLDGKDYHFVLRVICIKPDLFNYHSLKIGRIDSDINLPCFARLYPARTSQNRCAASGRAYLFNNQILDPIVAKHECMPESFIRSNRAEII